MNAGVEILLERLKDSPEDFQLATSHMANYTPTIWCTLLTQAINSDYIDDEEKKALRGAIREANRERYTESVMKALAGEDETSEAGKPSINPYAYSGLAGSSLTATTGTTALLNTGAGVAGSNAVTGNITAGGTWGTTAISTVDQQLRFYNEQLEAQYELVKAQADLEKQKNKHKTLFGKLFNYL